MFCHHLRSNLSPRDLLANPLSRPRDSIPLQHPVERIPSDHVVSAPVVVEAYQDQRFDILGRKWKTPFMPGDGPEFWSKVPPRQGTLRRDICLSESCLIFL